MALTSPATSTELALCNEALGLLNEAAITASDTTDTSYILCNRYYTQAVKEMLQRHYWREAMTRTILGQSGVPAFGYDYKYTLPADFIRFYRIDNTSAYATQPTYSNKPYSVEGGYLLTNEGYQPTSYGTPSSITQVVTLDETFTDWLEVGDTVTSTPTGKAGTVTNVDGFDITLTITGNAFETDDTLVEGENTANVDSETTTVVVSTTLTSGQYYLYNSKAYLCNTSDSTSLPTSLGTDWTLASSYGILLRLIYIKYITADLFSPLLRECVKYNLAIKIAPALKDDIQTKQALENYLETVLIREAKSVDSMEMFPAQIFQSDWLNSRRGN